MTFKDIAGFILFLIWLAGFLFFVHMGLSVLVRRDDF